MMVEREATDLLRLVRQCARRDRGAPRDELPIIVLWSARGSESSELLRGLEKLRDWYGPRAVLDGEQLREGSRPYETANRLAFQLSRKVSRFGQIRFPRFFLGVWAAQNQLDPEQAAGARAARREMIERSVHRGRDGVAWLRETAKALSGLAGASEQISEAVGLAVDGAWRAAGTLALLRGPGMRWYRDGLGVHFAHAADALAELSVREFDSDHEWVDEVLCRAFIADLRAAYRSRFTVFDRKTSALALLDNVGTPDLRRFVALLDEQRDGGGPLLVVAASHLRFPAEAAVDPASWRPDPLADASPKRWSDNRARRARSRYYPVWVDPVHEVAAVDNGPTAQAVREVAEHRGFPPAQLSTVAFAHRLTAAHPAGLRMTWATLRRGADHAELEARPVPNPLGHDLRGTLGLEFADDATLADAVFDLVLGPWTEDMRRGLVLMALAVDLSDAEIAPVLRDATPYGRNLIMDFRASDLWIAHLTADGQPQPPRLHPFARRAIASRLARAGGIGPPVELGWDHAHEMLRGAAMRRGDDMSELYHRLALGEVQRVASRLTECFDPVDPRGWYRLLTEVTAGPLAHPDRCESASAHFGELCTDEAPEPMVTRRLIAALTLHTDPLGDPDHDLCGIVANELNELARYAADGAPFLLERSKVYQRCWNRWHSRGGSS